MINIIFNIKKIKSAQNIILNFNILNIYNILDFERIYILN